MPEEATEEAREVLFLLTAPCPPFVHVAATEVAAEAAASLVVPAALDRRRQNWCPEHQAEVAVLVALLSRWW